MDVLLSESEIIRGLQAGDSNAWTALCNLYSERLWQYVARMIGRDEATVADVFQETLMAVARSGRGLDDNSRLWPWLSTIGHHQCALYWRKHRRQTTEPLYEDILPADAGEDVLLTQETIHTVRELLATMRPDHAGLLTAKYTEGLSVAMIAEQLGESAEAVRSRLSRARSDFRERFKEMTRDDPQTTFP